MRKPRFLVLLLFFIPFFSDGQKANFEFYTTADGLSGSFTHGIIQDELGFIWALNAFKLHRFDGRKFLQYSPPIDLLGSGDDLEGLFLYEDSQLLMTSKEHVFLLNPRSGEWKSFAKETENGVKILGTIAPFYVDNKSIPFFHSNESDSSTVYIFREERFEAIKLPNGIFSKNIKFIITRKDKDILIYHKDTVARISVETWGKQMSENKTLKLDALRQNEHLNFVYSEESGSLTLLTNEHVSKE